MKIYLPNGYVNFKGIQDEGYPFVIICGGRGTGKSYGLVDQICNPVYTRDYYKRRVYMRRTANELGILSNEELSPFKRYDRDTGTETIFERVPGARDMRKIVHNGETRGITMALSTVSNIRGFDGSDIDKCYYDEFIPERHVRPMRGEAEAIMQAYETINRNRELEGDDPLQMIFCANSNRADNPLFLEWGLVKIFERMKNTGTAVRTLDNRGIMLINLEDSPISKAKRTTALYRAAAGTDFAKMSIDNAFAFDDFSLIASQSLVEYKPYISIGEICIYKHKSRSQYYVSEHLSGTPDHYGVTERELTQYRQRHWRLWDLYISGKILFENYLTKTLFIRYTYK